MVELTNRDSILIVDDNPTNRKILFKLLDKSDFHIVEACDGMMALELALQYTPDIILLDVMMPGMDGFETCNRLKAAKATQDIPIIFTTSLSDTDSKVKGLSLGAVDYITKPFQKDEVISRIRLHLKLRSLNKDLQQQNELLVREITARLEAESELHQLNQDLEERVKQRTLELTRALQELQTAQEELLTREQQLEYDALHDALTNLPNRTGFMKHLERAIGLYETQAARNGSTPCLNASRLELAATNSTLFALLFIDLDRFKVVNDSLGHLVGDDLLKGVASRLQACLHGNGTIARFGGDEFMILLEDLHSEREAIAMAQRIQEQLRHPFIANGYELFTEASIGITLSTMGYRSAIDALRDADMAMYQAKQSGRGCYRILTRDRKEQAVDRMHIENELRSALQLLYNNKIETRPPHSEFFLEYQPIICLPTGQLRGFEALVRWNHPKRGRISPSRFIPVAEETGLINPLGWWLLEEACRQIGVWRQQFPKLSPFVMNVNVSAVQLKQIDFIEKVDSILKHTHCPGTWLKLEITESCLLETSDRDVEILKQLQKKGIRLCIDDFGTGYSSLSRLHEFPIDTLKIDRSFVKRLDRERSEVVYTIIKLAHSLGMDVVAEGVETLEQLEKLRLFGCELGQGFLLSEPLVGSALIPLLVIQDARFKARYHSEPSGQSTG
ncbi:EAL domain-containing response regulator [Oscillatoria sp. FACHB-1406]|uniref:two-component system response regulator n=1 Tax=Oscillatoria sp. FACHB-1406 TaxID=2692846 RepID=UPI00168449D7|nr:EAL domain-containing response regulator [Oscillatoria sp. FACHB-1406]MBD2579498.1 EAL domain-containing protein [Oscillatoria sp. FACHB-1406]